MYPLINGALAANASGDGYGNPRYCWSYWTLLWSEKLCISLKDYDQFENKIWCSACDYGTLRKDKVKGRIVYCVGGLGSQDLIIKELGGAGTIIGLYDRIDDSYTTVIPATFIEANTEGKDIDLYINSTRYVFFHYPFFIMPKCVMWYIFQVN